jgi:hypothetical protein
VKILFSIEGGFAHFPGLARPREIDTAQLSKRDAQELTACLSSTHLLERPATTPSSFPDARTYSITVIDGDHSKTVQLNDPVDDSSLESLIALLRRLS